MERIKIPFIQSFQGGRYFRKGNPLADAWKFIKRIGTQDNLQRIANHSNITANVAATASLRIRQAVELYESSKDTSTLTRPLLLYYCALNLIRGALLALHGEAGKSHGMRYTAGSDLLSCTTTISNDGTFPRLIRSLWPTHAASTQNQTLTLKQIFAQIPELRHDFHLIGISESIVTEVYVNAYVNAPTELIYNIPSVDAATFEQKWMTLLPWMEDKCSHSGEMKLVLNETLNTPEAVQKFCGEYLWRDLQPRQNPVWFDLACHPECTHLPRVASYLAGLFILSNVARYEPEILSPAIDVTDLAFVIETFLDCAERSIPLLIIELLEGPTYFE